MAVFEPNTTYWTVLRPPGPIYSVHAINSG